jgi:hypothetical protein
VRPAQLCLNWPPLENEFEKDIEHYFILLEEHWTARSKGQSKSQLESQIWKYLHKSFGEPSLANGLAFQSEPIMSWSCVHLPLELQIIRKIFLVSSNARRVVLAHASETFAQSSLRDCV